MLEAPTDLLHGTLHIFVAFDWGDEVDLEQAGRLAPGALLTLARRPRTPTSVAFQPTPWRFRLAAVPMEIPELGRVEAAAEATVFDFGAVSVGLHLPLALSRASISRLAGSLSDSAVDCASGADRRRRIARQTFAGHRATRLESTQRGVFCISLSAVHSRQRLARQS